MNWNGIATFCEQPRAGKRQLRTSFSTHLTTEDSSPVALRFCKMPSGPMVIDRLTFTVALPVWFPTQHEWLMVALCKLTTCCTCPSDMHWPGALGPPISSVWATFVSRAPGAATEGGGGVTHARGRLVISRPRALTDHALAIRLFMTEVPAATLGHAAGTLPRSSSAGEIGYLNDEPLVRRYARDILRSAAPLVATDTFCSSATYRPSIFSTALPSNVVTMLNEPAEEAVHVVDVAQEVATFRHG